MPLGKKDKKLKHSFAKQYGDKEGERVYYATMQKRINEGKPINTPESRRLEAKRKRPHRTKRRSHTRRRKM